MRKTGADLSPQINNDRWQIAADLFRFKLNAKYQDYFLRPQIHGLLPAYCTDRRMLRQ